MANYSPNIRKRRAGAPCSLDSTLQIKHKHKYRRARVCTVLASLNLTQQLGKSSTSKIKHKHKYTCARVCGVLFTSSKGSKYPVVGKMHASKREVRPNYLAMDYLMFR